ncbi:hypothetical protein M0R45_035475 [Rubus argutus]|uniref:Uncharacterized protein n=1 Tax=Rubus argutus TaxID=59490 RepID=A0AAW1VVT0_RUBAR
MLPTASLPPSHPSHHNHDATAMPHPARRRRRAQFCRPPQSTPTSTLQFTEPLVLLIAARLAPSATHSESPSLCHRARNSALLLVSISFTAGAAPFIAAPSL